MEEILNILFMGRSEVVRSSLLGRRAPTGIISMPLTRASCDGGGEQFEGGGVGIGEVHRWNSASPGRTSVPMSTESKRCARTGTGTPFYSCLWKPDHLLGSLMETTWGMSFNLTVETYVVPHDAGLPCCDWCISVTSRLGKETCHCAVGMMQLLLNLYNCQLARRVMPFFSFYLLMTTWKMFSL